MASCVFTFGNNETKCGKKAVNSGLCRDHIFYSKNYHPHRMEFYSGKELKGYIKYNTAIKKRFMDIIKSEKIKSGKTESRETNSKNIKCKNNCENSILQQRINRFQFISNVLVRNILLYMNKWEISDIRVIPKDVFIQFLMETGILSTPENREINQEEKSRDKTGDNFTGKGNVELNRKEIENNVLKEKSENDDIRNDIRNDINNHYIIKLEKEIENIREIADSKNLDKIFKFIEVKFEREVNKNK